ncbi:MAG: hypothetical protein ACOYNB_06030 [Aquabacterium sp.]
MSPRVRRHFCRLKAETQGLVDWHLVFNPGRYPNPSAALPLHGCDVLMGLRHSEMMRNGSVQGGYLDTVFMPCALALGAPYVWVLEYDVDFSGHWADFFRQFEGDVSDLLMTTMVRHDQDPEWYWWQHAKAPDALPKARWLRGFLPIMRLSRALVGDYVRAVRDGQWGGHYEFTVPTIASTLGRSLRDVRDRADCQKVNYTNTPLDWQLQPGSFVWRPSRANYFHECPREFQTRDVLFHPVKPGVENWERS